MIGQLEGVLMMQHIRFRVAGDQPAAEARRRPCREDVRLEARRRLNAAGYTRHRAKALAMGVEMPEAMKHFSQQVSVSVRKLTLLKPIPEDFRADAYWPVPDSEH